MSERNATDWVDLETKVPDQVAPFGGRSSMKEVVVSTGKGKKKKMVKLRIPRSMLQQEVKRFFNTGFFDAAVMDIPSGAPLKSNSFGTISSGGGAINRLGDAIFVHKVVYRFFIQPDATVTWQGAELAWVLDNEPAAGLAVWSSVFNTIGAGTTGLYHCAIPVYDQRFRYKYLRRVSEIFQTIFVWNGSAFTGSPKPLIMEVTIPIRRKVMYDASNAVTAGCELAMYGWSGASVTQPKLWCSMEVFFSDA